jgi:carboxylate-amine ligase
MVRAREDFEASEDFTVGLEEEFGILDPDTLELAQRFGELRDAAQADELLGESVAGELIQSEIEIRSGRGETLAEANASQRDARARLFRLAAERGARLSATGTHPWSPWQDQRIIDTDHYRLVADSLKYVAWRNNTFSLHAHVGVRGADRAIAVCNRLRPVLPELLAISANSPFLDGRDSGLHSARSQIFTKSFPRCGIPDAFGSWVEYVAYVNFLVDTNSIVEHTQIWWSVRPHHSFGTVEVNFWRAIRYGLDGKLIDLERGEEFPAAATGDRLLAWTAPARAALGIDLTLPEENGAQRQRAALDAGGSIEEVYAAEVAETQRTYAAEGVTS